LYETINLIPGQVDKDVAVVTLGGRARLFGLEIKGVGYRTYCWGCEQVDTRSTKLRSRLDTAKIPFIHNNRPGEKLP
jgi:hypothetical protein